MAFREEKKNTNLHAYNTKGNTAVLHIVWPQTIPNSPWGPYQSYKFLVPPRTTMVQGEMDQIHGTWNLRIHFFKELSSAPEKALGLRGCVGLILTSRDQQLSC